MFDNPKKELERIQQQLLAAESYDSDDEYADSSDEIYDVFDDDAFCSEPSDADFYRRSTGFGIPDGPYEMESDRYVPAPKKKKIGRLLFIALLELLAAGGLIAWWLGWLG